MAWILTKNKTNGSGGESQIDTIKVNDVILIPDSDKAVNIEVPTNTNDLVNNSGFITNTVDNLLNYYLKTETYSKNEVNSLIDAVSSVTFEVVQVLPSQDISLSTIYLVPKQDTETNNIYDEYIYVNNVWEKIGSTEMDLTNYVTTSDLNNALTAYTTSQNLNNLLNAKQDKTDNNIETTAKTIVGAINELLGKFANYFTKSEINTTLDNYYTKTEIDTSLSSKQDKTDNGIKTTAKTVVGAINELLNKFTSYYTKTEVNEKVDPIKAHTRTNLLNPIAQTQTNGGVTFTSNRDGTFTANGTSQSSYSVCHLTGGDMSNGDMKLDATKTYKLLGSQGGSGSTYQIVAKCWEANGTVHWFQDWKNPIITGVARCTIYIDISNGYTANNLLFKPMLTTDLSATYDDFVQYSGDGELNENVAEIYAAEDTLQNEGYKYPIINGVKNYTDSNGVYHKNLGVVDLGTLNWSYVAQYVYFIVDIPTIKIRTNNIECAIYKTYNSNLFASSLPNMGIKASGDDRPALFIRNTTYTDATAFKNAMSGVLLFYELETPQTWNSKSEISRISDETRTNLLNSTAQTETVKGVSITNNGDGTYLINGTYTGVDSRWRILGQLTFEKNTKCKLTGTPPASTIGAGGCLRLETTKGVVVGLDTGNGIVFNADSESNYVLYLQIYPGAVFNNYLFKPMITTDLSATYDDFVQYSGDGELNENVAEIYKVSDRVSDETYTNLINPSILLDTQTVNGVTCTNNGDGTFTLNGTASARIFFRLSVANPSGVAVYEKGRRYKLTGCPSSGVPDKLALRYLQFQNGTQINYQEDSKNGTIVTILQNTDNAYFSIVVDNGVTVNNVTFKPMLTTKLDATYDDYIPYSGSGALNENVAEMKSNLSAVENSLTAITLTRSGYTTNASAAMFGTCAFIDFLTSNFNQSTTGWITLFTFSNTNITPTATCYSTAIDNFGKTLMLRITPSREVSVYKYETNTPSDIRGQIIFPI